MKLDMSTVVGLLLGALMVALGMLLSVGFDIPLLIAMFVNQPDSAALTIGGSLGSTIATYPIYKIKKFVTVIVRGFFEDPKNTAYPELINEMVEYATEARRNGVLALDSKTEEISDPFIRKGIQLAVDGTAPEQIEEIMQLDLEFLGKRHADNQAMILKWAELAPAFGMIGTLVGLIVMLANLSNPDAIGPAMAIALVTTLYGAMLANMFCIPIAGKLEQRTKEEMLRREIIISAVLSIQNGDNPRIVQQKLITYVSPQVRATIKIGDNES